VPGVDLDLTPGVEDVARTLAEHVDVDEAADRVRFRDADGAERELGLHDYGALYAVPGLYEAIFLHALRGEAPEDVAGALHDVVVADGQDPAAVRVLDLGAGSGVVGAALHRRGFDELAALDIEPEGARAAERDRPGLYAEYRTLDLLALAPDDAAWLDDLRPAVLTVAGAIGWGHLPSAAFARALDALRPGGLAALSIAPGFEDEPQLSDWAALLGGPGLVERTRRPGVARRTGDGRVLRTEVLVLQTV
jgi:SAM-dependent methyltransferase